MKKDERKDGRRQYALWLKPDMMTATRIAALMAGLPVAQYVERALDAANREAAPPCRDHPEVVQASQ